MVEVLVVLAVIGLAILQVRNVIKMVRERWRYFKFNLRKLFSAPPQVKPRTTDRRRIQRYRQVSDAEWMFHLEQCDPQHVYRTSKPPKRSWGRRKVGNMIDDDIPF